MANQGPADESFIIGEPKDYLGGHISIGIADLLEAVVPIILYYTWMKPRIDSWSANTWYRYSWSAAAYGHLITFSIPFIFWCLSFMVNNTVSYLYVGMALMFGALFAGYVIATTIVYQF